MCLAGTGWRLCLTGTGWRPGAAGYYDGTYGMVGWNGYGSSRQFPDVGSWCWSSIVMRVAVLSAVMPHGGGHPCLRTSVSRGNGLRGERAVAARISQKIAVGVVFVAAMFMSIMDATIVNVALPTIGRDFAVNATAVATI